MFAGVLVTPATEKIVIKTVACDVTFVLNFHFYIPYCR